MSILETRKKALQLFLKKILSHYKLKNSKYVKYFIEETIFKFESIKDNTIKTLINNKDLRIKIGEEGRQTAKKYFDNCVVAKKNFSFIEKILLQK